MKLLEVLLDTEYLLPVVGTLEYDPDLPTAHKTKHREFLESKAQFKQVVPFENFELEQKIHQTFRIQYLKDIILSRHLDDATFNTLNSLVFFNNINIVMQISQDNVFLTKLFTKLQQVDTSSTELLEILQFLQEFCTLAKSLQVTNRTSFYAALVEHGLMDIFQVGFQSPSESIRLATAEIANSILSHDPNILRIHLLSQKEDHMLFTLLVNRFVYDPESGMKNQLFEIIKALVDVETMEHFEEKENFLALFYSDYMIQIIQPLKKKGTVHDPQGYLRNNICELLCTCTKIHGYRVRYFILGNDVLNKSLKLLQERQTFLKLAALRLFRVVVGMKDSFYNRHIIKFNLFDPIMEAFKQNGIKYNLLNSAILELIEFIRSDNIKLLVDHLVQRYSEIFKSAEHTYVDTFQQLLATNAQNQEEPTSSIDVDSQKFQDDNDVDDSWFDESDDDEEIQTTGGLVNYVDDEPEKVFHERTPDPEERSPKKQKIK